MGNLFRQVVKLIREFRFCEDWLYFRGAPDCPIAFETRVSFNVHQDPEFDCQALKRY